MVGWRCVILETRIRFISGELGEKGRKKVGRKREREAVGREREREREREIRNNWKEL